MRPRRPNAYSSAMPPTTGGNTSGSSTSARTTRITSPSLRAKTSAIGTPISTQSTVLTSAVRRLSSSAWIDDSDVIDDQKSLTEAAV